MKTLGPTRFVNIAHRGASGLAPEHTFAALDLAIEVGADYIEQDVQLTSDGVLVVLHDETLDRTVRGPSGPCTGPVRSVTSAQLREWEAGSWFNDRCPELARPEYAGLGIPTLAQVFERYGTSVSYYIEAKLPEVAPGVMERELLRLLEVYGLRDLAVKEGKVLLQSFSSSSLRLLHHMDPGLPLVQLLPAAPGGVARNAMLNAIAEYAVGVGPGAAGVDESFVEAAHERCLSVHPYTVDDPEHLRALMQAGVDGIFTNRPDVLAGLVNPRASGSLAGQHAEEVEHVAVDQLRVLQDGAVRAVGDGAQGRVRHRRDHLVAQLRG